MFGSAKYRNYAYGADDHISVVHTENLPKPAVVFITSAINKASSTGEFHYGRNFYPKDADALKIMLPINEGGEVDYAFMADFITALETERIAQLNAYLSAAHLEDCKLTNEEQKALDDFEKIEWSTFKLGNIFEKIKTKKLPFKAEDLPKQPTDKYVLPCLTSSFNNQGLNYFAPKDEATIIKNVISIPSNSDVYRAYFQPHEFTVLSDAYAIKWKLDELNPSPNQYLFFVPCINKVTNLSIYSYKNKLGGWNIVKNKHIQLPAIHGKPDYAKMDTIISAIKKLVVKDVIEYARKKTETASEVAI